VIDEKLLSTVVCIIYHPILEFHAFVLEENQAVFELWQNVAQILQKPFKNFKNSKLYGFILALFWLCDKLGGAKK
ncbi:MAG: hypothetical protein K2O03_01555, partial [Lachnospiraceae bacterium]|nr:hypothetical protein [Lachnospiraceae bacterium]